jgi:hypothetical protein
MVDFESFINHSVLQILAFGYGLGGIDFMESNEGALQPPAAPTATGLPNRKNKIELGSYESGDGVTFEIWRRHGDTVDWYLHATTTDSAYEDTDVKPGQYYEYKVRAKRGDGASEFSPSAVVYGAE